MTEIAEKSREEYEKKIEQLKYENQDLKLRIEELERENFMLQEKIALIEKKDTILEEKPIEIEARTSISVEPQEGEEKIVETPLIEVEEILHEQAPLDFSKKPIVEGNSRRECPICGNTNKMQIHEILDKTHIISNYPRMYGKKFKCGSCGREWRISSTFE